MGIKGNQIRVVLLNRNYPPQNGITGHSANELFRFLDSFGLDLNVVCINGNYSGVSEIEDEVFGKTHIINTFYSGKLKLFRLISSLYEGYMLTRKAISMKPNLIISMTDPALLNFWVSILSKNKKIPWVYWTMDLYPEAFASAGLISKNGFIYKMIKKVLKRNHPKFIISLGQYQFEYLKKEYNYNVPSVIFPCGISKIEKIENESIKKIIHDKISICYAGNLGEAHNPKFLKNIVDCINPKKHVLFLSLYGSKSDEVFEYAKNINGVYFLENLNRNHMHMIDVHLVSLIQKWDHVCVPSKAISAVSQGSAILFECSEENDNWQLLKNAGWRINFNDFEAVSKFMSTVSKDLILIKRKNALELSNKLKKIKENSFNNILNNIVNV